MSSEFGFSKELHKRTTRNRYAVEASASAGCFYCLEIWEPSGTKIAEFIDHDVEADDGLGNATVMCPFCGIDSVLASLIAPITPELLSKLRSHYFGPLCR